MSTQSERRVAGIDVLRTLPRGTQDPGRAAHAIEALGALGSFTVDHAFGNLWSRRQLSRRDRSMIVVTFLAASGAGDELSAHVLGAINHGLTRAEVEEIVNQVAGYASFPMAMHATRLVDAVWLKLDGIEHPPAKETAVPSDDEARHAAALDVMGSLFAGRAAGTAEAARAGIVALLGGVGEMALSRVEELAVHVPGALNHGCSRAEVEEIMVQLTAYGGFPRAVRVVEGIRPARAAFQLIDERAARG